LKISDSGDELLSRKGLHLVGSFRFGWPFLEWIGCHSTYKNDIINLVCFGSHYCSFSAL